MKHTNRAAAWLLIVCMMLTLCLSAGAEGDLEEVSITIFGADGETVQEIEPDVEAAEAPEETPVPVPTVDPTIPVLEGDGSVLLTMSFTGE